MQEREREDGADAIKSSFPAADCLRQRRADPDDAPFIRNEKEILEEGDLDRRCQLKVQVDPPPGQLAAIQGIHHLNSTSVGVQCRWVLRLVSSSAIANAVVG